MYIMMSYFPFSFWDGDMDGWMDEYMHVSKKKSNIILVCAPVLFLQASD